MTLHLFLLVLALVLLLLAALKVPEPPWVSYGWMGAALIAMMLLTGCGGGSEPIDSHSVSTEPVACGGGITCK